MQNAIDYYVDLALVKFRKVFFHAERNLLAAGKESDPASSATEAMFKTREEIMALVKEDPQVMSDIDREQIWARALYYVMFIRQLLVDLKTINPSIAPAHHIEKENIPPPNSNTIAEVFTKGIEKRVEERQQGEGSHASGPE